jgi:hypothetical protein
MGDVTGGLERANGGVASEAGLGRGEDSQCRLWGSGEAVMLQGGRPVSETLGLRPRANRRCSETPLSEASDEVGRWAGWLICLAGGPARKSLACLSFVDCFP